MNFVYYYDDNHQEPKPGDLLFLYMRENQRNKFNLVGIVVSTSVSIRESTNPREVYNIETMVLKPDGTIVHRVLIWNPICIKNNYSTL